MCESQKSDAAHRPHQRDDDSRFLFTPVQDQRSGVATPVLSRFAVLLLLPVLALSVKLNLGNRCGFDFRCCACD